MRPGAKKSIVWEPFHKVKDNQVQCRTCKKILKFFGNTTNLDQHIKRILPTLSSLSVHKSVGEEHSNEYEQATIPNNQNPGPSSAAGGSGDSKLVSGTDNNLPFPPKRQRQMKLFDAPSDDLKESDITKIDNALIKMITKDYQPLSVVEDEGFIEFTNLLQPKYKLASRKILSYELLPKFTPGSFSAEVNAE
ncbi:hypothetical protein JTB14_012766 [Gonioctena quinquepunctata]|nr:hypothetical protein JTB14_012766 [Gonioctena quinquepunctata]